MADRKFNWSRYWVPREGKLTLDSNGFLVPPYSSALWGNNSESDVVGIDEIASRQCLVLLGEPGIGKTHAIRAFAENVRRAEAKVLLRDLSICSSDSFLVEDVFRNAEFEDWRKHGGELHLFLDSFDECLLRVDTVASLLADQIARLPRWGGRHKLFFRIASRTAEWRTALEDSLRSLWEAHEVGVYELAPLTREQVEEAVSGDQAVGKAFISNVVSSEVVSFAVKPLTLKLLINVWKQRGGSLPPNQREIYEQGCLKLCEESENRQSPRLRGELSPEQRLAVAAHIAAAIFLCNRAAVWTGANQNLKPEGDLSLAELATGSVTVNGGPLQVTRRAVEEALNTGLFTSRGAGRLSWAHQTYGEFLAARYLMQQSLTFRQICDLFIHPHDPQKKLIPQLKEAAAWLALPGSNLFDHLTRVQPDALLRSDVTTADTVHKAALVDAIIHGFTQETLHGNWSEMHSRYRKLKYPALEAQLRRYLLDQTLPANARSEVIWMADYCNLHGLMPDLVAVALNLSEDLRVREVSATVVARSGDKIRGQLRPLALGQAGQDPEDELRGAGLSSCWPDHMTAVELFSSLVVPNAHRFGLYQNFLSSEPISKLANPDLVTALEWARNLPQTHQLAIDGRGRLIDRILDQSIQHIEVPGVLAALALTLLVRLRHHEFPRTEGSEFPGLIQANAELRLTLLGAIVTAMDDPNRDAHLVAVWGHGLVSLHDLPWLLEQLRAASPDLQERLSYLIRWVFHIGDAKTASMIIETAQMCPILAKVMSKWLTPVLLRSKEAEDARQMYKEQEHRKEQFRESRPPKLISPSPSEMVTAFLNHFEAGDMEAWWKLGYWLEITDEGRHCEKWHNMDIRQLVGWTLASSEDKARMVVAAERYLRGRDPKPEEWFGRRDIRHNPAVAGFRALLLLVNENLTVFNELPSEIWRRWMPAILRPHYFDELNAHRVLTKTAMERAPSECAEWTVKVAKEEYREGHAFYILHKLPDQWDELLGVALLEYARAAKLKPQFFNQLLEAMLKAGVRDALAFARSKVPKRVPANERSWKLALFASRILLIHGEPRDWVRVRRLISIDDPFTRGLVESLGHEFCRQPKEMLKTLSEADIAWLWERILGLYPTNEDPDRRLGGEITTRYAIADLRDGLVWSLGGAGTEAGCRELLRLIGTYPQFSWFRGALARGEEALRRKTWRPVAPTDLFQMAIMKNARLVESGEQLLEVLVVALKSLQDRWQGETAWAQFLWDGNRPKTEESISEWIKGHLEYELGAGGIVLGREVQIHRFEKTDIHVTAITHAQPDDSFGSVKLIIEVKGCWHPDIETAMKDQLLDSYLRNNDCRHGIYLVGWFEQDRWDKSDSRRGRCRFTNRQRLNEYLVKQAQSLSVNGKTVEALVIDFTQPSARRSV